MSHSFVQEEIVDLMMHRGSLFALAILHLSVPLAHWIRLPGLRSSFLVKALLRPGLTWLPLSSPEPAFEAAAQRT